MLGWSRLESWLAVVVSVLLVTGAVGNALLGRQRGAGLGPVIIETIEAAAPSVQEAGADAAAAQPPGGTGHDGAGSGAGKADASGKADTVGHGCADAAPAPAADAPAAPASSTDQRLNINLAQASELERLPGIGPALARRIVEYREAWGPFSDIADILEVPGIGPAKFQAIKDLIRVE